MTPRAGYQPAETQIAENPKKKTQAFIVPSPHATGNLRHAPRRKSSSGSTTAVPSTPAMVPAHWKTPAAGEKPKPKDEFLLPDFKKWKQMRQGKQPVLEGARLKAARERENRAAPETDTPVPLQPGDVTPGLPSMAQVVKAPDVGSETPMEQGGMTPMLPAGEMTPFLNTTPHMAGEATPQAYGQLVGDQTPALQPKLETVSGADTPVLGGMTPSLQSATPLLSGVVTPSRGGEETPAVVPGPSGLMTPAGLR